MSISQSLFGGGNFPSQPTASGTTVATTEFPKELAPFIKDILEKSKAMQSGAKYKPYLKAQLAPFNPLEQEAMTALESQTRGLAGTDVAKAAPYFTGAKTAIEGLGQQFTGDTVQQFMNPYQQAVTDQAKLKATEDYEAQQNVLAANAIKNQPFGGSRQAITEGMAQGDYLDRLSNIQERGLAAGFTQGRAGFEAQKGRELQMANALMGMGATVPQQAYRDLGIRQQIGETERAHDQQILDLGTKQFMEEREFPTRALQEYSATVRGFPFQPSTYTTQTSYQPQPGIGQQLVNLAGQGLGGYTAFTGQPMQNLFQAEGGITTLPTYYNQRGDNDQRQISIYDLIDTQTPEAQQFYAEQALAQEQQEIAEAQQLDAMDLEYYIEEQNRPKSLREKIGNILYSPQQGIKNLLKKYGRNEIGNRLRPNLRRAEGGLTGLPVYYNESGDNEQRQVIEGNDGILYEYTQGQGIGGLRANTPFLETEPMEPWEQEIINAEARNSRSRENISNWFSGLDNKLTYPFSQEYEDNMRKNILPTNQNEVEQEINMPEDPLINLENIIPNIVDVTLPVDPTNKFRDIDIDPNSLQLTSESPATTTDNTANITLDNLNLDTIRDVTNMNMETVEQPDIPDYKMSDVEKLNILSEKLKTTAPGTYQDKVLDAFSNVDLQAKINKMIDMYTKIGSPAYAEKLKGGASERQALGQGLSMMKAFSSSDPTKGIIGNLSEQIGSFAENVGPTELAYLQELDQIDNLGVETPINSVKSIVDVINSAYNPAADRDINVRKQTLTQYLADNDYNLKTDTLGYNLLSLLYNSKISEEDLKQKGKQINNNSKFNQRSLENDLIKAVLTYKGTLASSNASLSKLKLDAISQGYIDETDYNNIYKAVASGLSAGQIIFEQGAGMKIISGEELDAETVIKINQAMADIIRQVGNAKMFQTVSGLTGKRVEESAAEMQSRLISQYKVYFDEDLPQLSESGKFYFKELSNADLKAGKDFNKFSELKNLIVLASNASVEGAKNPVVIPAKGDQPEVTLSQLINITVQ